MAVKKTTPKERAAARSKAKQGDQLKHTKAMVARPGKTSEAGMANIPASIARLGKVAIDAYRKGAQAGKAVGKPKPKVNPNGTAPANSPYSAQAFAKRAAAQKAEKEKLAREATQIKRRKATESAGSKNRYENTQKAKSLREEAALKREANRIKKNNEAKKSTNASIVSKRMIDRKGNSGWR